MPDAAGSRGGGGGAPAGCQPGVTGLRCLCFCCVNLESVGSSVAGLCRGYWTPEKPKRKLQSVSSPHVPSNPALSCRRAWAQRRWTASSRVREGAPRPLSTSTRRTVAVGRSIGGSCPAVGPRSGANLAGPQTAGGCKKNVPSRASAKRDILQSEAERSPARMRVPGPSRGAATQRS
jgi:hypothetical protein